MRTFLLLTLLVSFALYGFEEKPMVVVIPSYNNAHWYERNLDSACFQNYANYRIIYIDDCSTDGTADLVEAYLQEHQLHHKVTLVRNPGNRGAMANHYTAIWMCRDEEIIVHLDGDDWLKHNDVLAKVNAVYQDPSVWMTYGQFERHPKGEIGYCKPIAHAVEFYKAYREADWVTSHLRTFYAGLAKQIKLKDVIYKDDFFRTTYDMAIFFPLLELAASHVRCVEEVLYVYNEETPANDYKNKLILQLHCDKVIRSRDKYPLGKQYMRNKESDAVQIIIFYEGQSLLDFTEINKHIDISATIHLVYHQQYEQAVKPLMHLWPQITAQPYDRLDHLMQKLVNKPGYMLLVRDAAEYQSVLPIKRAMSALEQTQAACYHFALDQHSENCAQLKRKQKVPKLILVANDLYAWHYLSGEFDWRRPFGQWCLVRTADIKQLLSGAHFSCFDEMHAILEHGYTAYDQMGLCGGSAAMKIKQVDTIENWNITRW